MLDATRCLRQVSKVPSRPKTLVLQLQCRSADKPDPSGEIRFVRYRLYRNQPDSNDVMEPKSSICPCTTKQKPFEDLSKQADKTAAWLFYIETAVLGEPTKEARLHLATQPVLVCSADTYVRWTLSAPSQPQQYGWRLLLPASCHLRSGHSLLPG